MGSLNSRNDECYELPIRAIGAPVRYYLFCCRDWRLHARYISSKRNGIECLLEEDSFVLNGEFGVK